MMQQPQPSPFPLSWQAMPSGPCPDQAARWLRHIFSAHAAKGGVVRRSVDWIDREVGRERFIADVRRRGFHLISTGTQYVVVCHHGPVEILF